MKKLLTHPVALWAIIALLVLWPLFRSRPTPLIDEATRAEALRLRASHDSDSLLIDSLKASAAVSATRADRAVARAQGLERVAAVSGTRADSLARSARTVDSSAIGQVDSTWRLAYDARTAERDQLLAAAKIRDSADADRRAALHDVHIALDSAQSRSRALDVLNNSLLKAVEKAERGCRIIGPIRCPSRKQSAVAGSVLGLLAGLAR